MTLKNLPELKALDGVSWDVPEHCINKWDAKLVAEDVSNTISIFDVIGSDFYGEGVSSKRIAGILRKIGNQDVVVNINSPGGDYFEGVAIYNLLRTHKAKVTVRILGTAASAASVIAMSGDVIEIARSASIMIHNSRTIAFGDRQVFKDLVETMAGFDKAMAEVYASQTGQDVKILSEMMDREVYFHGKQAVDEGFATSLMDDEPIIENARDGKAIKSIALMENALRIANPEMSRKDRLNIMNSVKPSADTAVKPSADKLVEALKLLDQTVKS